MSFQNHKDSFSINRMTRMNDDYSAKESQIRNNRLLSEYRTFNMGSTNRDQYLDSSNRVGIYQNNNKDGRGKMDDYESHLMNGRGGNIMTSSDKKMGKSLGTRLFPGAPYMGAGQSTMKNVDIGSQLMTGEITHSTKSTGSFAGVHINRFTPLLPCLKGNIQNVDHIVPRYWVRGGESTRTVVRNIDYLRNCGLR